jgi:predicted phosphodiesterase
MKILVVADEVSKAYYDYFEKSMLDDIDLILSCGDLPAEYLSFLVTFAHCPLLYVRGNHDVKYSRKPPEGCICVEDQIYEYQGLRILGLGGSMRYIPQAACQYSPVEMRRRVRRLWLPLKWHRGFDILLTHAPAAGIGDGEDWPHRGFEEFNRLMDKYSPRYMIHGHMHFSYTHRHSRLTKYGPTTIINGFESYVLEVDNSLLTARREPVTKRSSEGSVISAMK